MKALLIIATFFGLILTAHADVKSSQILRARIDVAHLDPADYRGGAIELLDRSIKLILFVESTPSKVKEMIIELPLTSIDVNECGLVTYEAINDNMALILEDRAQADCGRVYNFKVALEYITADGNNAFTSRFDGSDFSTINFDRITIPVGQQNPYNNGPSILPVIPIM